MKTFVINGRCIVSPPPTDWRENLASMLGAKPRRIGMWAELGMYGALRCMDDAGESSLPDGAILILASQRGTYAATNIVMEQMRDDLPMPLAFLQTQPSQLLALLAAQMNWKGHACFMAAAQPAALLRVAAAQAGGAGMLLGWVDEMDGGSSNWLRMSGSPATGINFVDAIPENQIFLPTTSHIRIAAGQLQVGGGDN
jgi:hypothetical protein